MPTVGVRGSASSGTLTLTKSIPTGPPNTAVTLKRVAAGLQFTSTSFGSDALPPIHVTIQLAEGPLIGVGAPVQVLADGWARSDALLIDWVTWDGAIPLDTSLNAYPIPGNTAQELLPEVRFMFSGFNTPEVLEGLVTYVSGVAP